MALKFTQKGKAGSLSLRRIQILMVFVAILVSGILIFFTYSSSKNSQSLSGATQEYITLHDAADELMDASDYMTEMAQRFTDRGDRKFLNAYFQEAFTTRRREEALEIMNRYSGTEAVRAEVKNALKESISLMDREYYSMRLVIEAQGYTNYPEPLDRVTLKAADVALTAEEKMDLAQSMLLDEEYYSQKDRIRSSMGRSLDELTKSTQNSHAAIGKRLDRDLRLVRIVILVQTVIFLLMIWITIRLGIHPVLVAVKSIQADSKIPEMGASEFHYLAQAYNKMYEYYNTSIQRLNYKASHDELTKVYNRSGYDLLLSSIDLGSTYFLLIDVDNFKDVNDTYGHEVGDRVLQKIADTIRKQFRSDDYVCRIGGDEFAVLMTHAVPEHRTLLGQKLERINRELSESDGVLPCISISAGVAHGRGAGSTVELYEQADRALYETKRRGRNGYTIHEGTPSAPRTAPQ